MTRCPLAGCAVFCAIAFSTAAIAAEPPRVVVSIKPIHSLVAAVMQGAGEPMLLIGSGASPHTYGLKPSDARALQEADLIFWVGEGMEAFLSKPLASLSTRARVVELAAARGVMLLGRRQSDGWEPHTHRDCDHQPTVSMSANDNEHEEHSHEHGGSDMHIWLDADNARAIVRAAVAALDEVDPGRAALYRSNGEHAEARIDTLDQALRSELTPLSGRPYVVFHDAYWYLEHRYGLTPMGSITVGPELQPSAQRIATLRKKILDNHPVCIFSEPQFEPSLVETMIEGTGARVGVLDAEGGLGIAPGPDAYFTIMRNLGDSLKGCLTAPN
jgi:zinc transport system substrate-binding protein